MRRIATIVLPIVGFAVVMLAPLIFGGRIFYFRDFGEFYAPVKAVCLERMLAGELPIWLPGLNCGTAVHGELVHGLLYPGNLLLLAGGTAGWGLYFAFHLTVAGLGTRALARRLGASADGALLAGIAYAGSGYVVAQMNHVPYLTAAAWCPVIVLLGLNAAAGSRGAVPLLALVFALTAVGGEPLLLLLTILFLAALVMAGVAGARRLPGIVSIGAAGIVALLLAAPALLPALETLSESVRGTGIYPRSDAEEFGCIHPMQLLTLFSPEACGRLPSDPLISCRLFGREILLPAFHLPGAYLGAVPLVLLLFAPFRKSRAARLLVGIAVVSLVLSLGAWIGASTLVRDYVPGMSVFRFPYKYWLLGTLSVALLAGLAVNRSRWPLATCALAGAVLAVLAGFLTGRVTAGFAGMVPFVLVALAAGVPPRWRVRFLSVVLAGELLFFGLRQNATEPAADLSPMNGIGAELAKHDPGRIFVEFLFPPQDAQRLAAKQAAALPRSLRPNFGLPEGFSYSIGYDPTDPSWRRAAYLHTVDHAPLATRVAVSHRLLDLAGTSHSVSNIDLSQDPALRLIGRAEPGIRLYEYPYASPRVRLYGSTRVVANYTEAQALLADLDFDATSVLILEGEGQSENRPRPFGEARIVEETPERVRIRVRSKDDAWLSLADTMARGWTATVNGEAAPIRPANIAFRAVRIPAGTSEVEFRYEPAWLTTAPWWFAGGLLGLALLILRSRRRSPGSSRPTE